MPRTYATEENGVLNLTDDNVYWGFKNESLWVRLKTTNECPIVYVNRHADHPQTPCDGLISVRYPQEAIEARCNEGPANIYVTGRSDSIPTIIAGDAWLADDRLNRPMSVPALLAVDDWLVENLGQGVVGQYPAFLECDHAFGRNVLGVHAVGSDYGCDGVDRFLGHQPIGIAHVGGAEDADKFVRLAADAIRALPKGLREKAAYIVPNLIRRGQKCVMSETDFMSGKAWHPALRFADIDCAKVLAQAEKSAALPLVPILKAGFTLCGIYGNTNQEWQILGTDFHERPFNRLVAGGSPIHLTVVARTMARTVCIDKLSVTKANVRGELVWKVLQGDPQKVRVATAEDGRVTIEVDYHVPFDVAWGDGAKIRTSRVDVGCFCVMDGVASTPAIVSVYFSPNETRAYDADGHIVSVDYTKSWIKEFCPTFCARGDWKDAYQWTDDGQLLGWTRTYVPEAQATLAAGRFGVVTNVFTRDGFVVDSRDALGRPQNVHRSMRATWAQKLDTAMLCRPPADRLEKDYAPMESENFAFDFNEGFSERMVLAWNYAYESAEDRFGTAKPRPMAAFSYDPAVCPRADFADETTGFRLPLLEQVERGYETYVGYKRDVVGGRIRDVLLQRPDSYRGVVDSSILPQTLKKMRFCAWTPLTNDVWTVNLGTFEQALAKELFQLGEGAYRYARRDANDGTVTPLASVGKTLHSCHWAGMRGASVALKRLDREEWPDADEAGEEIAHRCGLADDFVQLLRDQCLFRNSEWGCLPYRWALGDGKGYLVILRNASDESADGTFTRRLYRYCLCPDSDGDAANRRMPVAFAQLPSRAIGNTVLRAWEGEPDALNNLAVLLYAGVANPDVYDEKAVVDLLQRAAQKGNAMASFNLDVLYANNGGRTTPDAGTNDVVSATPPICAAETPDAGTNVVPSGASFDIPPPLRVRMEAAYNDTRDKRLSLTGRIDVYEFIGLNKGGVFTNALEIAKRPRGEMAFCDDGLTEAERARLWPFDVEAFEQTLERKMARDAQGCYCLKAAYAEGQGALGADGNLAVNPTIRWVNGEIERWAVGQMDGVFKRVDDKTVCRMFGLVEPDEDMTIWTLDADGGRYFVVSRREGAWKPRDYFFVRWDGEDGSAIPLAEFTTFPTRREAMTFRSRTGAAANNLAVLEWRHRVNQGFMDPRMISTLLGRAYESGVPTALANLKVLLDHIPEVADFVTE